MAADEGKVKIEKFDGADFGFWKMQIEDYLYKKKSYINLSYERSQIILWKMTGIFSTNKPSELFD